MVVKTHSTGLAPRSGRQRHARDVAAWLVALALGLVLASEETGAQPIDLEADHVSYDQQTRTIRADGNVSVRWKGSRLEAEHITVEQEERRIVAEGDLRLFTPELRLDAAFADLDIDDETGTLTDVKMSIEDLGAQFGGSEVKKGLGSSYSLTDGTYTTCTTAEGEAADWSLAGRQVDLDVGGYGVLRHGTFRIKDVPVLYFPYLPFPAHDQRQSGVLLPEVGVSNERGFIYRQPLFLAIDKHQDVTLTAGIETSARIGLSAHYRYEPARNTSGQIELAYFNEKIRGNEEGDIESPLFADVNIPQNRGMVSARHRQEIRDDLELYGDALLVSDDLYLREVEPAATSYVERALRRSLRYTVNRLGLLSRQGFSTVGARALAYQDFVDEEKQTLQRPAELWAAADGELAGVGYVLDGELTRFVRRRGADGLRFDGSVTLSRELTPRGPLISNAWVRGRFNGYQVDERSVLDEDGDEIDQLEEYASRAVGETGLDLKTAFAREFVLPRTRLTTAVVGAPPRDDAGPVGRPSMLHLLEPFTGLRFTSSGDEDNVPLYDELDRIDDRTTFTYGVGQRFLFRDGDDAQREERARFSVAQTYNLEKKVIDDHFSDIDLSMAVKPVGGVSLSGLTSYNVGSTELTGAVAEFSVGELSIPYFIPEGASMDVVYRFARNAVEPVEPPDPDEEDDNLETIEARGLFELTDRVAFGLNGRYDFPGGKFVESGGGIRISSECDCWAIDLGLVNRVNPDETEVRLAIELRGLGGLGSSALEYQTPGLAGVEHGRTIYGRYGW